MKILSLLYQWIIKRLPTGFSLPMMALLAIYFALVFPWLVYRGTPQLTSLIAERLQLSSLLWKWLNWTDIVSALITIGLALLGVVLSYGVAAIGYRFWRKRPMKNVTIHEPVISSPTTDADMSPNDPLQNYKKIGIILAGGGAKGAYQAGAMKAIYEFLDEHKAHHKVSMIAGTSIGSWNSLFWLAGLIKGPDGRAGLHEQWWHEVNVQSVIRPVFYVPLQQNFFLSSQPWQETFDAFFIKNSKVHERLLHHIQKPDAKDAINFYFTRSNVALAHLEFTTNRTDLSDVQENLQSLRRPRPPVPPDRWKLARSVNDIRDAVFSSMDVPPLFEYMSIDDETFEDGGVVDNLPIRFGTEIEKCDFLFILPLNASFEERPNLNSIVKRLFRVIDVRQGVLERNAFKMIYLYNELAGLRGREIELENALRGLSKWVEQFRAKMPADVDRIRRKIDKALLGESLEGLKSENNLRRGDQAETSSERAMKRRHKAIHVFSICPAPHLIIESSEFWKTKEAGHAFRLMYESTKNELKKFEFGKAQEWIQMALVSPYGKVTYLEDF